MKIFNPRNYEYDKPIFFCRFNKTIKMHDKLFKSRCKRAVDLMNALNLKNEKPGDYYEIDKALEAAIKMKGRESTHFELLSSDSYKCLDARKQLRLLERIHNIIPGRLHRVC